MNGTAMINKQPTPMVFWANCLLGVFEICAKDEASAAELAFRSRVRRVLLTGWALHLWNTHDLDSVPISPYAGPPNKLSGRRPFTPNLGRGSLEILYKTSEGQQRINVAE